MSPEFTKQLKEYPYTLYYNNSGDPRAFKLSIQHLSAAPFRGEARISNLGYIYPNQPLHIVNLERESIEIVATKIKLIELE